MKKLLLLISFTAPFWSMAQSATILPDGVSIPKVSELPVCNTSEKGKQVFNSTVNRMYFCNGTNWQEMTGGGFTLPYSNTASTNYPLLYLENTGSGRAIYGKSTSIAAIKGESDLSNGVYGVSNSGSGIYGESISGFGVYGSSSTNSAGFFVSYGAQPTLFVLNDSGDAASFRGNVKMENELAVKGNVKLTKELIVDDGKGIVRSNSATQQKVVRTTITLGATLPAESFLDGGAYDYENFGDIPTVTVGQVINANATGSWQKVLLIPIDVTATGCKFRIVNTSNSTITFGASWQLLMVGPE